ncbi:polyphosphate polymerase domain-containing protein [Thermophagus xiamenensis]|uniref:VTC domain-containing protein n=1 Tax=Thermophagus xiamenensis TaxID=385682 RepID=A0A1I1YNP7_9BACT|nr:polyphosphate polymerase domain-containing protein [Thermophagus xiamenensis]SFE21156.1 VTC domain-containing protein [Thermophagus xiamenensis]
MIYTEKQILHYTNSSSRKPDENIGQYQLTNKIQKCLEQFSPVSLLQMKKVQLMTRTDRKFVVAANLLPDLLSAVASFYKVQQIDQKRIATYATVYYDTPDYFFYHAHVKGKLNRTKIRIRQYVDSDLSFLEIKNKNNKGVTNKIRIQAKTVDNNNLSFLKQHVSVVNPKNLPPSLNNKFQRITLVNHQFTERLTIDFNIIVKNCRENNEAAIPNLCIIEVKQSHPAPTPLINFLKYYHIRASGLSKYCLGISITTNNVKKNNYKPKIHFLQKRLNHDLFC